MVGRLVEDEEGGPGHDELREGESALLAAGEPAHVLEDILLDEQEPRQQVAELTDARVADDLPKILDDGVLGVQLEAPLGEVAHIDARPQPGPARERLQLAENHLQDSRLAAAIGAHHPHPVAPAHEEVHALDEWLAVADCDII